MLETLDTGKPLQETLVADAASGADCLEYFAGLIAADTGQYIDLGSSFAYTRREPLGVCVGIGAWNYPIQIAVLEGGAGAGDGQRDGVQAVGAHAAQRAGAGRDPRPTPGCRPALFNVVQGAGDVGAALVVAPGGRQGLGDRLGADRGARRTRRRRGRSST